MFHFLCFVFLALSFLDFQSTMYLMRICGSNIEGNPVASFCYELGGYMGMAAFKITLTVLSLLIAYYVRSKKFRLYAYLILVVGCVILVSTVSYSLMLTNV